MSLAPSRLLSLAAASLIVRVQVATWRCRTSETSAAVLPVLGSSVAISVASSSGGGRGARFSAVTVLVSAERCRHIAETEGQTSMRDLRVLGILVQYSGQALHRQTTRFVCFGLQTNASNGHRNYECCRCAYLPVAPAGWPPSERRLCGLAGVHAANRLAPAASQWQMPPLRGGQDSQRGPLAWPIAHPPKTVVPPSDSALLVKRRTHAKQKRAQLRRDGTARRTH